jgi:hypothetical protein
MFATYQCEKCDNTIDYRKEYGVDFPETILEKCCNKNKSCTFKRIFGIPVVSVGQGYQGNAANGYSKSHVYHPSPLTPINKTRKSKQDSVLSEC